MCVCVYIYNYILCAIISFTELIMYFDNVYVVDLLERGKKQLFKLARYIPSVRDKINTEIDNINNNFEKDVVRRLKETSFIVHLPEKGLNSEEILNLVKQCIHLGKMKTLTLLT